MCGAHGGNSDGEHQCLFARCRRARNFLAELFVGVAVTDVVLASVTVQRTGACAHAVGRAWAHLVGAYVAGEPIGRPRAVPRPEKASFTLDVAASLTKVIVGRAAAHTFTERFAIAALDVVASVARVSIRRTAARSESVGVAGAVNVVALGTRASGQRPGPFEVLLR